MNVESILLERPFPTQKTQEPSVFFSETFPSIEWERVLVERLDPKQLLPTSDASAWLPDPEIIPEMYLVSVLPNSGKEPRRFIWFDTSEIAQTNKPGFRQYDLLDLSPSVSMKLKIFDQSSQPLTLDELDRSSEKELKMIHGIGKKGARQIKEKLEAFKSRVESVLNLS